MISKNSRIFLLLTTTILIIQIIVVKSQDVSVNPITPEPTPTIPISLTNHIIKVGYMDYGFSRNNFSVGKGNVLHWEWVGKLTHSVVESTLENPCKKKDGGFDLGQHTEPFNSTMGFNEVKTVVFFSDVSDDCAKGMYGGINLPQDYTWPKDLVAPPAQIVTTPLNPTPTPTPTPSDDLGTVTGSMTILAGTTDNAQASSNPNKSESPNPKITETNKSESSSESANSSKSSSTSIYYLNESIYGIGLVLISLYFNY